MRLPDGHPMRAITGDYSTGRHRSHYHETPGRAIDIYPMTAMQRTQDMINRIVAGRGQLFMAPLNTTPDMSGWTDLGYTTEDGMTYTEEVETPTMYVDLSGIEDSIRRNETNPDALENAALALMAKAQEQRAILESEPADDTVITWEHKYSRSNPDAKTYTFVAFRKGDRWFTTKRNEPNNGVSWAVMCREYPSLREGRFWTVGKWEWQGESE